MGGVHASARRSKPCQGAEEEVWGDNYQGKVRLLENHPKDIDTSYT